MKKLTFLAATLFVIFYSACKTGSTDSNTSSSTVSGNQEVLADQIECDVKTIKPDDWADEDWNDAVKNIDRKKIFTSVVEAVLSGKQKAYNYVSNEEYTIDQLKKMMSGVDTVYKENPSTGEMTPEARKWEVGPDQITFLKVREKWLFDAEAFKLTTVPVQMIICKNVYGADSTLKGQTALFYVKLNN